MQKTLAISSPFRNISRQISITSLETEYQQEVDDILKGYQFRAERRQALVGKVVSTKCMKTVNVLVPHWKYIPKYDKKIRRHNKEMAHDEESLGELGDLVRIVPCRPMSKKKRHVLKDIIKKAPKLDLSGSADSEVGER